MYEDQHTINKLKCYFGQVLKLAPAKLPVMNLVPEPDASSFKMGCRAIERLAAVVSSKIKQFEVVVSSKNLSDGFSVIIPVSGDAEFSSRFKFCSNQREKRITDDASFMMTLLGPGVREVQV